MPLVTVSPKYQIVIPKEVREKFGIKAGQKVSIIPYEGYFEIVPVKPLKEMRGFAKGIDASVEHDPDREF